MYFYSEKSDAKVFHITSCGCFKRLKKGTRKHFSTLEEAEKAGYRPCKHCATINKYLKGHEKDIKKICESYHMKLNVDGNRVHVSTKMSHWQIIIGGKDKKIFLYHKNTRNINTLPEPDFVHIEGYHSQKTRSDSIEGFLYYIADHDIYVKERQKANASQKKKPRMGTEKWRKQQKMMNKTQKKQAIGNVLHLLDSLTIDERSLMQHMV